MAQLTGIQVAKKEKAHRQANAKVPESREVR